MTKSSDLLVAAVENEGVKRIFGIAGEEKKKVAAVIEDAAQRASP
jgi:hypothetical protein